MRIRMRESWGVKWNGVKERKDKKSVVKVKCGDKAAR
jgi:hypothetical protein